MLSDSKSRKEILSQTKAEQNFYDDVSSVDRKRRAEEVELLSKGREGFENMDKYLE